MSSGSHYTVLARRFRPQAFDDVVGQEHVSKALKNAIRSERVAHAYLFTGARGVGKTSTARILAKALNCPQVEDGVPCNKCEICDGISAGNDVDVLEIDGASNRGINDIRSLRANVGVRSMRTRYKVYIIDEVHMLTREAFNALLKTLEEPPPNVKFVFCTTEPEKVPDTILSRCQRFDFSTIEEGCIGQRLREIAEAEGFDVEDEAIELVARRAHGSMRDSQSLFDQLLAFSEGTVTGTDVHRMLGTASDEMLSQLFDHIVAHRPGEVLNLVEEALSAGVRPGELLDQCVNYIRDLMVLLSDGASVRLTSVGDSSRENLVQQAKQMELPNVLAAFQILSETKGQIFRSTFARVLIEMALVQVALLENLTTISSLLSGNLPALPSADANSVADDQKKTPELAVSTADDPPAAEFLREHVEFSAEHEGAILSQLMLQSDFTLSGALKKLERLAISEPNELELVLGSTYDFQKRVFETSEHQASIQRIVEETTGVRPLVKIRLVSTEAPPGVADQSKEAGSAARPVPAAGPETKRNDRPSRPVRAAAVVRDDVDPEKDSFVQEVVEIFGARVEQVINAPANSAGAAAADQES